ncbi:MAG: carboxypeptidase-like regulatory domain-containing protein [Pirellulales bacterium]
MNFRLPIYCLGFLFCGLLGCGSGSSTVPVQGIVTLDGETVEGATIAFTPVEGGRLCTGATDASGTFKLTTKKSGDGAMPGSYKVTVIKVESRSVSTAAPSDPEAEGDPAEEVSGNIAGIDDVKYLLPLKYGVASTSGLTVEVESGMSPVKLELTSK